MKKIIIIGLFFLAATGSFLLFSKEAFIFIFSSRIWAHRVNSLEKKQEAVKKFTGVELDVVFNKDSGYFDVNHPPAPSVYLSLKDYLLAKADPEDGYWLDFKNLEPQNAVRAYQTLDAIVAEANIDKRRVVVESPEYPLLHVFASHGYPVSYYLPTLYKMKADSLAKALRTIKRAIDSFPAMYISSYYKDYWLMKKNFPERTKLLWWTGSEKSFWHWRNRINLYRIMCDPTVKIFLVPFHATTGNR